MIALFFLGMIIGWFVITLILFLKAAKWKNNADGKIKIKRQWIFNFGILAWLFVSFWFAGGRTFYYDWKVESICKDEGGVKVYEKVKLKDGENLYDNYRLENTMIDLSSSEPTIVRTNSIIIRKSDGKVMGEAIRFGRRGGCIPEPFGLMGCTYKCSLNKKIHLEDSIIVKE